LAKITTQFAHRFITFQHNTMLEICRGTYPFPGLPCVEIRDSHEYKYGVDIRTAMSRSCGNFYGYFWMSDYSDTC